MVHPQDRRRVLSLLRALGQTYGLLSIPPGRAGEPEYRPLGEDTEIPGKRLPNYCDGFEIHSSSAALTRCLTGDSLFLSPIQEGP